MELAAYVAVSFITCVQNVLVLFCVFVSLYVLYASVKFCKLCILIVMYGSRVISVGILTRYGLDGPGIESQCWKRFSAPAHRDPEAHPVFCTMGTGSFHGVKRPGCDVNYTHHIGHG